MTATGPPPPDGDEELLAPPPHRRRGWPYVIAVVLLAAAVVVVLDRHGSGTPSAHPPPSTAAHSTVPHSTPQPASSDPFAGRTVSRFGHPILGITGSYELFVRVSNAVLRVQFAQGAVTSTPVPALASTGPVTFLATSHGAIVRPIDAVPGYFVPDGKAAVALSGALARAAVLPGPDPDDVWLEYYAADRLSAMELVEVRTGAQVGQPLRLPTEVGHLWGDPDTDGSGYLLVRGERGLFDLRPDGAHRLPAATANGTVLATGSDRLLVADCARPDDETRCQASLVRLPSGLATPVGTLAGSSSLPAGVIAPNLRTALVYQPTASGQLGARLLDLTTGSFRSGPVPVDPDVASSADAAVFSPDGRWLFEVAAGYSLVAVDVATGAVHGIGMPTPNVFQVAVRPG